MYKFLVGLLALSSISAFADELTGLKCSTQYVLQAVSRNPYNTSRVVMRKSLLGGRSVLGFTAVDNQINNFIEEFNLSDSHDAITYSLNVQKENSAFSAKINTKGNEVALLDGHEFVTKEGFTIRISLLDLIQIGTEHAIDVVVTCLPVYETLT